MPARTRRIVHDANTRAKIQTSQIINRLQKHIDGDVEMPATAVTAALGLLRKTLPDISAIELTGAEGGPIVYKPATPEHEDL